MQFTPQQLTGFGGYGNRTLVGNWSEDQQLQSEKQRAFLEKVQSGGLLLHAIQRKAAHHMTPSPITPQHPDGYIHFGDRVVLQCAEHNGFLSVDLDDEHKVAGQPKKVIPTCAPATQPVLRNIWILVRVPGPDDDLYPPDEVDVLHYNQPFKLELTPELCGERPLSLYSEPISGTNFSRVSRHQEVAAVDRATTGLVWRAMSINLEYRMEMEGMPIQANVAIVINHSQTNNPLCSKKEHKYLNDFGQEWEVCCFADRTPGTKQRLLPEQPPNHWAFITGPPDTTAVRKSRAAKQQSLLKDEALQVVDKIRTKLLQRGTPSKDLRRNGGNGFRGLTRVLTILADHSRQQLDKYELDNGLQTCGINLQPSELNLLLRAFGSDRQDFIALHAFIDAVRGPLNDRRRQLVVQAFEQLDVDQRGTVSFEEMKQLFDAKKHPDVLAHMKTPEQVLQEFVSAWDKGASAFVTFDEFLDYYADIGAAIDNDDFFELMVRNSWHISGGKGVAANTSCRRVVVTHVDGTQTVEEIKNDLRIPANDLAAMRQNLEAQGIRDIRKLQLYS